MTQLSLNVFDADQDAIALATKIITNSQNYSGMSFRIERNHLGSLWLTSRYWDGIDPPEYRDHVQLSDKAARQLLDKYPHLATPSALWTEEKPKKPQTFDFSAYLTALMRHRMASEGPGEHREALIEYIQMWLWDLEPSYGSAVDPWIKVATIALEGAVRHGATNNDIIRLLEAELEKS